jgi:hypothetical protein
MSGIKFLVYMILLTADKDFKKIEELNLLIIEP